MPKSRELLNVLHCAIPSMCYTSIHDVWVTFQRTEPSKKGIRTSALNYYEMVTSFQRSLPPTYSPTTSRPGSDPKMSTTTGQPPPNPEAANANQKTETMQRIHEHLRTEMRCSIVKKITVAPQQLVLR